AVAGHKPPVAPEPGPRDPPPFIGAQKHRRVRNIVRLTPPAGRIPLDETLEDYGVAVDPLLPDRRPDRARRDGVAPNPVPAVTDGYALGEVDHPRLGCAVSLVA